MNKIIKIILIALIIIINFTTVSFSEKNDQATSRFQVASGAFSDQFYEAALSLFKRFINDFPENELVPAAKLYIAKCLYYRQKYSESLTELKRLKEGGNLQLEDQINYWLAKIFFEKTDYPASLDYLQKITKNASSDYYFKAKHLKALIYLKTNQTKKAKANFEIIIQNSVNQKLKDHACQNLLQVYINENDFYSLNNSAKKYLDDNPQTEIKDQIFFYLAEIHYKKDYLKESIRHYKQALLITDNPQLRDLIYQGLGLTYLKQDDPALAKRTIDKIIDDELRIFSQGLYYFNISDHIQALESFDIYLKRHPKGKLLAKVYLKKADTFYEMGRINDSLSVYNVILKKFSGSEYTKVRNKAHYGLAWCYLKNSNFKKAIAEFKKALEYSNDPAVKISSKIQIADAYQEAKKYQEALDIYNQIIKDYPNTLYADYIQFQIGMIFIKEKMLEEAFLSFRNLTKNFPNSKLVPEAKYYLAVGYFSQNKYQAAEEILSNLINEYPHSEIISEAYYLYAKCFFNQKKYQKALDIFLEIINKYKNLRISELAYYDAGLAYLNLDDFTKAKDLYRKFVKIHSNSEYLNSVNFYLGGIYEKEGNFNEAEKYYKKVAENSRETLTKQEALLSLGHLAWQKDNLEKAKQYFKEGAQAKTSFGLKSKLYLAKAYQQNQETEQALKLYEELIQSQSKISEIALIDKAFLLKDLKKYQQAAKAFKEAVKGGSNSAPIRFALGQCLEKENLNQEAIGQYFKLIYAYPEEYPDDSDQNYKVKAYFRIAKIYENQKDLSQAKKAYQKIIDLEVKESKIAKKRLEKLKNNQ